MTNTKKILSFLPTFLFLCFGFLHPITAITQDLGRHLKTGEIILQNGSIPKINLFSYTYPDFPFINHHWFSEVIFYIIFILAGFNGLLLVTLLAVTIAFSLVFFASLRKKNFIAITIASLLYIRILFERTDIRPEIFSFLFLSLFITILYRYKQKATKLIFLLPFFSLLWVNMHIYFIVGILVITLFLVDQFLHVVLKRIDPKPFYQLLIVFSLSCLLTFINPNGIQGALYPFQIFGNYGYTIEENQTIFFLMSIGFNKPTIPYFFTVVLILSLSLFLTYKKTQPIDWLLAICFTIFGAMAVRNLPLFVFATFIPFVRSFSPIVNALISHTKKRFPFLPHALLLSLAVIFIWQANTIIQMKGFGFGVEKGAKGAADFFITNNLKGPVFNNFDIGSYLEYRIYPKEKVFVDGRPEAYPASFFKEIYIPMQENQKVFAEKEKQYTFNTIFFTHTDQTPWAQTFLQNIVKNTTWIPVYIDDTAIILVKKNTKNKKNIATYGISEQSYQPSTTGKTQKSLLTLARFLSIIQWKNQEAKIYQELLQRDPNFCLALHNIALLYASQNNPSSQIYATRFTQTCN